MQGSYQLKFSERQGKTSSGGNRLNADFLHEVILDNADQIGYMLQAYYSREKISKVSFIKGSEVYLADDSIRLKLEYVKEEYNACSAIDTELRDAMIVNVRRESNGTLTLTGENWPEL